MRHACALCSPGGQVIGHSLIVPDRCESDAETVSSFTGWRRSRLLRARVGSPGDWPGHTSLPFIIARKEHHMRARYPDQEGFVERDGVKIFYEVFGTGEPTVLLLPTWSIVHSRIWKAQVPYLARH